MLTTGFLTIVLSFVGTTLSAVLPGVGFDLPSSFEPNLRNYEPESFTPLDRRDSGNCGSSSYYNPSVGTGACGWQNTDNELVVALPSQYFQGKCGQSIAITANGKSITAKIVDLCPSCEGGHVDMSPALFQHFADLSQGRVNTCWTDEAAPQPAVVPSASPTTTQVPSPQKKQAAPASSESYSFPPDFEPPPKGGPEALTQDTKLTPVTMGSQTQLAASSSSSSLSAASTSHPPSSAALTTLHITLTRTRTTTVPHKTSTVALNTGAELYEAAIIETSAPLPTKYVVGGLLGAVQGAHRDGQRRNGTEAGMFNAIQGAKGWLEWTKHLHFLEPNVDRET